MVVSALFVNHVCSFFRSLPCCGSCKRGYGAEDSLRPLHTAQRNQKPSRDVSQDTNRVCAVEILDPTRCRENVHEVFAIEAMSPPHIRMRGPQPRGTGKVSELAQCKYPD